MICPIVEDLVTIAQEDLVIGRFDDVREALACMREYLAGQAGRSLQED